MLPSIHSSRQNATHSFIPRIRSFHWKHHKLRPSRFAPPTLGGEAPPIRLSPAHQVGTHSPHSTGHAPPPSPAHKQISPAHQRSPPSGPPPHSPSGVSRLSGNCSGRDWGCGEAGAGGGSAEGGHNKHRSALSAPQTPNPPQLPTKPISHTPNAPQIPSYPLLFPLSPPTHPQ